MKKIFNHSNKNGTIQEKSLTLDKLKDISIQKGNVKLTSSDKYLIYNFSILGEGNLQQLEKDGYKNPLIPKKICPNATNECIKTCYNNKYYFRDSFVNGRISNFLYTLDLIDFKNRMIQKITNILKNAKKQNKKVLFRIHVEGEFYNYNYMLAWFNICNEFVNDNTIKFYTYTKSVYFLEEYIQANNTIPTNLNIMLSIFNDINTSELNKTIELINNHNFSYFSTSPVNEVTNNKKTLECRNDCSKCLYCVNNKVNAYVSIH